MEKINILIRTHNRPELFKRCLDSCISQVGAYIKIYVAYDCDCDYIPNWIDATRVTMGPEEYFYDAYCNVLKAKVNSGYFLFLDDDDVLAPGCLSKIIFDSPAILVQLNHMGNIIPKNGEVQMGRVGMPCLILHHSLKDIADIPCADHNDYHWIKAVSEKVELKFQPLVVVVSDRKGNGA